MQILSMTSEPWQEVLDRLPPELDLDTLAVSSGALKRRREVGDGTTLLCLAMARGPGGLSLNQTATWAAMQGLARLSEPAVKYRLESLCPVAQRWISLRPDRAPAGPAAGSPAARGCGASEGGQDRTPAAAPDHPAPLPGGDGENPQTSAPSRAARAKEA